MKIPLPQRGQPIDVDYIYQIVNQLNSLTNQVSSTSNVLSSVDNGRNGRKDSTTNNLKFFATTKSIKKGSVTAATSEPWTIDFSPAFIYVPVAFTSVINNNNSTAGNNIVSVITNITNSQVTGNIFFNSGGNIDVNLNVFAIGTT